MPAPFPFDLASVYAQATDFTLQACELLREREIEPARRLLERRRGLLRQIHQWAPNAPAWGANEAADQAALLYLAADRRLAQAIDVCC
jgi:hypothetical protein